MKMRFQLAVGGMAAVCLLAVALVWAFARVEQPPTTVRTVNDIAYTTVGGRTLHLDLAMPEKGGPFPAVVCVHGGGWTGGSRRHMAVTIQTLAKRGYVAIAPDYRLAPADRFPACVQDCKTAVRWLRANAETYSVNPEKIGMMGLSAGGHLACLTGMTPNASDLAGTDHAGHSCSVQAVVAFSAPTNLAAKDLGEEVLTRNLLPLFGDSPAKLPDAYRKASPLQYKAQGAPPMLLVHGSEDKVVPVQHTRDFAAKLQEADVRVELMVLDGEGHTWTGGPLLRSIDRMLSFLDETLQK